MCFIGLEKHNKFVTVDTVLCSEAKYLDYVKQYEKMLCSLVWQYVSYRYENMDGPLAAHRIHNTNTYRLSILKVTPAEETQCCNIPVLKETVHSNTHIYFFVNFYSP